MAIVVHSFPRPLPYLPTLALQQQIHELQLKQRRASLDSHKDILFLLQHRPVYTVGRRQNDEEIRDESIRLRHLGADFVATKRGGQTTYHGPGQVVGYPLFDLSRMRLSIADYIAKLQITLKDHFLQHHCVSTVESDNTGVFLTPKVKLASIGIQVRHRLTGHGFAYNLTREPLPWFNQVVACGLADISAGCLADAVGRQISPRADAEALYTTISRVFDRGVMKLDTMRDGELEDAVRTLETKAEQLGTWPSTPVVLG